MKFINFSRIRLVDNCERHSPSLLFSQLFPNNAKWMKIKHLEQWKRMWLFRAPSRGLLIILSFKLIDLHSAHIVQHTPQRKQIYSTNWKHFLPTANVFLLPENEEPKHFLTNSNVLHSLHWFYLPPTAPCLVSVIYFLWAKLTSMADEQRYF